MPAKAILQECNKVANALKNLPVHWDGREAILQLKEMDFQWRQMEWIGFYFEALCRELLKKEGFVIPGKKYGNVSFDAFRSINWDMKAHAIKSNTHDAILNDIEAIDKSVSEHGCHGVMLALLDVEYNDDKREFQKWHTELKGGLSDYEKDRIKRNATSRYRKTQATLKQILLLGINGENRDYLSIYSQGRNSDGSQRNKKYMLNIEKSDLFETGRVEFL